MTASILLTYRASPGPERHQNLLAVLGALAQLPEHEVIIVEQDALPTLTAPLPHPRCRSLFVYNPGAFNKAWGFNIAARLSEQPVLVFSDADVIAYGMLDKSIAHCAATYSVVKPYRSIVDLSPEQTARVHGGEYDLLPPRAAGSANSREAGGEYVVICGGLFVMRAAAFRQLGGWDERFRGWGGEDDALSYLLQRQQLSTLEFDERPALHLWHPRSPARSLADPDYQNNCALLERYRRYSTQELQRFVEVNRQAIGHSKKYEPQEPSA
jgi:hypothetical protein